MRKTPLDRLANPREIAGIAVFPAFDDAGYGTGATILASGGGASRDAARPPLCGLDRAAGRRRPTAAYLLHLHDVCCRVFNAHQRSSTSPKI